MDPFLELLQFSAVEAKDADRNRGYPLRDPEQCNIPEYRRGDPLSDPLQRLVAALLNLDVVLDVVDSTEMFVVKIALVFAYFGSVHRFIHES